MPVLKLLLIPFSLLYRAITGFRNHLYDIGYKHSVHFDRFVIGVGNLTVGGTGKTPFVELLIRYLKSKYEIAVLSRGYGRKTRGFRLAGNDDNAVTLGDEPFQYLVKYGDEVKVAVGEERAQAIPELLFRHENIDLIIMDDAYQHRSVAPDLNILLNDFNRPFYQDRVMPAGLLRESRKNAQRANLVVVTKCPEHLEKSAMDRIEEKIHRYAGEDKPVFFSGIKYLKPVRLFGDQAFSNNVFLFSGIASHGPLERYVSASFHLVEHVKFPDHYTYSEKDIKRLISKFEKHDLSEICFLTTEKDMVRLLTMNEQLLGNYPVFYLPIELYFLKNEDSFAKLLDLKIDQGICDKGM
jgi:tetraacyldisaccharide 4'-kinase